MSDRRDALESRAPAADVPVHVAIIMDGNGRWAKSRGLPRTQGHRRGADAVRRAVEESGRLGIRYLTLFGFSSENWKRSSLEIDDLMGLLRHYLRGEIADLHKNGIRLRVIGERARLAPDIVTLIANAEAMTAGNTNLDLTIALSYGARAEIAAAARGLARDALAGRLDPESIDEAAFARRLATAGLPDPDLLIRTSGEQRLSNFLLWQLAYAELVFLDTLWPDFGREDLDRAIGEFRRRDRRYGAARG
jgi:undecaprenyl diphosphate synthase